MNRLDTQIDAIEGAYEYLLEYAAQGREDDIATAAGNTGADKPGDAAQSVADHLSQLDQALQVITDLLDPGIPFHDVVADDISKIRKALTMISTTPRMSSELIDNLIASMHLKVVLTDLFLISETNRIAAHS